MKEGGGPGWQWGVGGDGGGGGGLGWACGKVWVWFDLFHYCITPQAVTAKQHWAPLPADKHTGSWELPAWRCLVAESEEEK